VTYNETVEARLSELKRLAHQVVQLGFRVAEEVDALALDLAREAGPTNPRPRTSLPVAVATILRERDPERKGMKARQILDELDKVGWAPKGRDPAQAVRVALARGVRAGIVAPPFEKGSGVYTATEGRLPGEQLSLEHVTRSIDTEYVSK
jgi:hypothetical protein